MAEEHLESTSRRFFATGAGLLAVGGFVASAAAETRAAGAAAAPRTVRKTDLARLSNALYNSPTARAEFLANPQGYAGRLGLKGVGANDLAQVQKLIADGFCCGGCGCSGGAETTINPSN